jgi:DNA-directed RNA polymerase subunit RPC12/RpoP
MSVQEIKILSSGLRADVKCPECGKHRVVKGEFKIENDKIYSVKITYYRTA